MNDIALPAERPQSASRLADNRMVWLGLVLSLLAFVPLGLRMISTESAAWNFFGNADLLYSVDFGEDLHQGGTLKEWKLTPAPYLFPDLVRGYVLTTFVSSPRAVVLISSILQIAVIWLAWIFLAHRLFGRNGAVFAHVAFLGGLAWGFREAPSVYRSIWFLDCHAGNFVMALGAFHALLSALRGARWAFVVTPLVCWAGSISDPFFVAGWAVPVAAVMLVSGAIRRKWSWLLIALLVGGTGVLGHKMAVLVVEPLAPVVVQYGFTANVWPRLSAFDSWWYVAAVVLLAASVPAFVALVRRQPPSDVTMMLLMLSVGGLVNLIGNAVSQWDPPIQSRYMIITHWYALLAAALLVFSLRSVPLLVSAVLVPLAFGAGVYFTRDAPGVAAAMSYVPPEVACVEQAAKQVPLRAGLADYLGARPVHMMTTGRLLMAPITGDGYPNRWISGRRTFVNVLGKVNFVLLSRLNGGWLQQLYGPPSQRFPCATAEVWFYEGDAEKKLNDVTRARFEPAL